MRARFWHQPLLQHVDVESVSPVVHQCTCSFDPWSSNRERSRASTRAAASRIQLADRRVEADIHSGSGGCIGDVIEGDMRLGVRTWRNVGNSILSVVQVVAIEPAPERPREPEIAEDTPRRRASDLPRFHLDERWSIARGEGPAGDQNSNRKLS